MIRSILFFGVLLIAISGCRNSTVYKDVPPTAAALKSGSEIIMNDKVLFHFSYKNETWGYENTGQFIDSSGNIYSYKITDKKNDLIQPTKGFISKASLYKNFQKAKERLCTIPQSSIRLLYPHIKDAAKGPLSDSRNTAYNQGDLNWYAYSWVPSKKKYARVLLRSWGDYSRRNLNPEAIKMYENLMHLMNNSCN